MSSVAIAGNAPDPFWVGIAQSDDILIPIGTYDEGKWINTWPETSIDEQPEIDKLIKATNGKAQLQDIPAKWIGPIKTIPAKVYLWSEAPRPRLLKVLNAVKYGSHCSGGWALKTDLYPRKEVDYSPTPKVGIATNRDSGVIPFESNINIGKLPASLRKAIKSSFDGKYPVEFVHIYKASKMIMGGALYFIEAQQKSPYTYNPKETECYDLKVLNSWLLLKGDKISALSSEFIPTDCWGKETHTIVPNAVIFVDGKHYVVSENYGYEWESYTIHQILNDGLKEVLNVGGGGC